MTRARVLSAEEVNELIFALEDREDWARKKADEFPADRQYWMDKAVRAFNVKSALYPGLTATIAIAPRTP